MRNKLAELNIPAESVRWQERYYDGDYRDPANYKTRRFFPQNDQGQVVPGTNPTDERS